MTKEEQEIITASETLWKTDEDVCKIRIEIQGDISQEDVLAQCEHTILGLGYDNIVN